MRLRLLAFAIFLAACQADQPSADNVGALEENLANLQVAAHPSSATGPSAPDTPISSDDLQPAPLPDPGPTSDCPVIRSSDWHAHVDAMPGPNDNPRLIVSGKVTVPTGGYQLTLRMGAVAESYPVQVTVHLDVVPPKDAATQAVEIREVRGSWRSEQRVGSVTVRCGGRTLARLANIETAH